MVFENLESRYSMKWKKQKPDRPMNGIYHSSCLAQCRYIRQPTEYEACSRWEKDFELFTILFYFFQRETRIKWHFIPDCLKEFQYLLLFNHEILSFCRKEGWNFLGGPVAGTPCFQYRSHGFSPWLGDHSFSAQKFQYRFLLMFVYPEISMRVGTVFALFVTVYPETHTVLIRSYYSVNVDWVMTALCCP